MPYAMSTKDATFLSTFQTFLSTKREQALDVQRDVAAILAKVQKEGNAALIEYTRTFDRHDLRQEPMAIDKQTRHDLCKKVPEEAAKALQTSASRIRAFHEKQKPHPTDFVDDTGARLGWEWRPIQSVGLYVPGGQAAYPSSVLMNALPARIAGVERLSMVVPTPNGALSPMVIYAAELAGVDDIYPIGGAQAIAALAFGTETIAPVDKIVGPGNAYVAAAKKQVFGQVGIDMVAGPSEVVIYADDDTNPEWLAMDLLAQAEHDEAAQSILISPSEALLEAVSAKVDASLKTLPRSAIAAKSWRDYGALIAVSNKSEAIKLINRLAPEHLQLVSKDARAMVPELRAVGAIFIGALTPEAIGDYVAGSNHVLPTGRTARFSSGLGVLDFMTRFSIVEMNRASLDAIGDAGAIIADCEGLDAHAKSIRLRLNGLNNG